MRASLSTIQQTLTPEAATVLNHSISEAGRRNHGQTTPLHVAATLLASPSGFLRQACSRSHPNSSHPLQCRALELCFSVALERLPTSQSSSSGLEPPISNALMATLKRAQAHQRRGCPEQQQQPLLAVKVELEQLILSILDDPSVSRVMREASFSSPAVKATIEQSLNSQTNSNSVHNPSIGLGFRTLQMAVAPTPCRNLYLNPRLQQGNTTQSGQQRSEEAKKVIDILSRTKKRNPVLVGDSEPDAVVKEVLKRIENKEMEEGTLKNIEVIHLQTELAIDRTQIPSKIKELAGLIKSRSTSSCNGVILDLGDLKWLVEQPVGSGISGAAGAPPHISEMGRSAVAEMGKLLELFGDGSAGRVWLIATATCETYLRCQVYHPTMENDWDLQAMPIAARAPLLGMFPRLGTSGILNGPAESLIPLKSFPTPATALPRRLSENLDPARRISCCRQCMESYEQDLSKLAGRESEKSSADGKSEADRPVLPQWLQIAKANNNDLKTTDQTQTKNQELIVKHQTQELQKKWNNTCMYRHPDFHRSLVASERISPTALSMTGLYNQNLLGRHPFQPKLQLTRTRGQTLQLNPNLVAVQTHERAVSPPGSPVRTDLALGQTKTPEKTHTDRTKDLMGCISSEPQNDAHDLQNIKLMTSLEADFADSFKKLLKGLNEKVWWQREAASAVATSVTQCKLGNGRRRGAGSKRDIWFLLTGPDRVGKKKIAYVLSEQVGGDYPIIISLGSRRSYEQSDMNTRGKTVLDRIAEAVRRNPFSVIILEDIDEADMLIRGSIKQAMERGRLADSHGREISLGNVIFILTANWLPDNAKNLSNNLSLNEEKLATLASGGWQLRLAVTEKTAKRRANWLRDKNWSTKHKKDNSSLSFDLNETADAEDDKAGGSLNSSDLTIDHEDNHHCSASRDLLNSVDESIVFKPVDSEPVRFKFSSYISTTFATIFDEKLSIELQDEALEKILGGVWLGRVGLEEWTEKYLVPSFRQLKTRLPSFNAVASDETMVVRLELDDNSGSRSLGDWLPSKINLVIDV